jgi:hypothetical protein
MAPHQPTSVRITAHRTPHPSDPPDAHVFYAALGMLSVAWGRLEGHVNGNLLTIMNFPEMSPPARLPLNWERRRDLWKRAFSRVEMLQPHSERAVALMNSIVESATDRNFAAHAIWGEFIKGEPEPTMYARVVRPRKGAPDIIEVTEPPFPVSLSIVERF